MELKPRKVILYLTSIWIGLIVTLGSWWLYLIIKISTDLEKFSGNLVSQHKYIRLAKWEGTTFFILILLISLTLIYYYTQDLKKSQSLRAFFASLTHELKTPLASMRLQAEVINETKDQGSKEQLDRLTSRLIEDAQRLEDELDKLLQLSRIERGGHLKISEIVLNDFFETFLRKLPHNFTLEIHGSENIIAQGDEFALNLILRNLVDNTLKHTDKKKATLQIERNRNFIVFYYEDYFELPSSFHLSEDQLGKLFVKGDNSKGSGVGLYLAKQLASLMSGSFEIQKNDNTLLFQIKIPENHEK